MTQFDPTPSPYTGEVYSLSKNNTYPHRAALSALGIQWNPEVKLWQTFDRDILTIGLGVVDGTVKYELSAPNAGGHFEVTFLNLKKHDTGKYEILPVYPTPHSASTFANLGATPVTQTIDPVSASDLTPLVGTKEQIIAALKELGYGTVGMDYDRASKQDLIDYGVVKYTRPVLLAALGKIREALGRTPFPGAPVSGPGPAPVLEPGTQQQAPVAAVETPGLSPEEQAVIDALRRTNGKLDEARVREIARDVVDAGLLNITSIIESVVASKPKPNVVTINGMGSAQNVVTGAHKDFARFARCVAGAGNVALTGPAGCGKSLLVEQFAESLGRKFLNIGCSAGVSEQAFGVRLLPGAGGNFLPYDSAFVQAVISGSVICLDEFDAMDQNVALILNQVTSGKGFYCEARGVGHEGAAFDERIWVAKHPDTIFVACMNTFGTGASMRYQGRNALDGASMNRWLMLELGYDEAIDRRYITDAATQNIVEWVLTVRRLVAAKDMERIISHRDTVRAVGLIGQGFTQTEVKQFILAGWSTEEKAQVGA